MYYNYRHYNPSIGRWSGKDAIFQLSELNDYSYVNNNTICQNDVIGNYVYTVEEQRDSIGGIGSGYEIYYHYKISLRIGDKSYYMQFRKFSQRRKHPAKGLLWIISEEDPGKMYHLDRDRRGLHHNARGCIEKERGFNIRDHSKNCAKLLGKSLLLFKYSARTSIIIGFSMSAYDIYHAEDKNRESIRQLGGWIGAAAFAWIGGKIGAQVGAAVGGLAAGAGAIPGAVFGGVIGTVTGGAAGWWGGTIIADYVYDTLCNPAENEEYTICE